MSEPLTCEDVGCPCVEQTKQPQKLDTGKPQLDLLLNPGAVAVAKALTYGAMKYGRYNYLSGRGLEYSRLAAAATRHLTAWLTGEAVDSESGLSHLAHAGASIVMLADLEARGLGIDDRFAQKASGPVVPESRFPHDPMAQCPECGVRPGHAFCPRVGGPIDMLEARR